MDNQHRPTVQHMEHYSVLCGSLDGRGVWGECIHLHIWLSLFTVHLKLSEHSLLIGYTPIQNKSEKKKKNNKN